MKKNMVYFVLIIVVLILFQIKFGLDILIPTNVNWILSTKGDLAQHYLGWAFYKEESWHFPLGRVENIYYPLGTSVSNTDSTPLFAFLFKLFSGFLSDDFQYIGISMFLSYILLAFFAVQILILYTTNNLHIVLIALIITLNPVILFRGGGHDSLCAQWVIVASIYHYLVPTTQKNVYKINCYQTIILLISVLIHPYLGFIILGFSVIIPIKNYFFDKSILIKDIWKLVIIPIVLLYIIFILSGIVDFKNKYASSAWGYGHFSMNLNALYNSQGYSSILPGIKVKDGQYEGFLYLGLGMIIMLICIVIIEVYKLLTSKVKLSGYYKYMPLFILSIFLLGIAITNIITFNDMALIVPLPDRILDLLGTFRASGRMGWLFYYTIIFFAFIYFIKTDRISVLSKNVFLLSFFILQFYEIKPLLSSTQYFKNIEKGAYKMSLDEVAWRKVLINRKHIITYPVYTMSLLKELDYTDLAYLALKNKLTITSFYVAREPRSSSLRKENERILYNINNRKITLDEVYVTTKEHIDIFNPLIESGLVDTQDLDGYFLIYAKQ